MNINTAQTKCIMPVVEEECEKFAGNVCGCCVCVHNIVDCLCVWGGKGWLVW